MSLYTEVDQIERSIEHILRTRGEAEKQQMAHVLIHALRAIPTYTFVRAMDHTTHK